MIPERFRGVGLRQRGCVRAAVDEGRVVQDSLRVHLQLEGEGDHRARQDLREGLRRLFEGLALPHGDGDATE